MYIYCGKRWFAHWDGLSAAQLQFACWFQIGSVLCAPLQRWHLSALTFVTVHMHHTHRLLGKCLACTPSHIAKQKRKCNFKPITFADSFKKQAIKGTPITVGGQILQRAAFKNTGPALLDFGKKNSDDPEKSVSVQNKDSLQERKDHGVHAKQYRTFMLMFIISKENMSLLFLHSVYYQIIATE